jgi:hypothetical protein
MLLCDIVDLEEALKKTGADLFKELYRIYPMADPEDYFKNGQWKNDLMKNDLTLLEAHRREAGAPDAPDIDTMKFPKLPVQAVATPVLGGVKSAVAQAAASGGVKPAAAQGAVGTSAQVEVRLVALFVAKWKLDPAATKECLSKLTQARRRYVIQQFKTTSNGEEATTELKAFIAACEKDGKWDAAATTAITAAKSSSLAPGPLAHQMAKASALRPKIVPKATAITPVSGAAKAATTTSPAAKAGSITPVSGLKRPFAQVASTAYGTANKRPTLATITPAAVKPHATAAVKPGILAKAGVRPPAKAAGKLISGLLSNF